MKKIIILIFSGVVIFFAARDGWRYLQLYRTQDTAPTPTPTPLQFHDVANLDPVAKGNLKVSAPLQESRVALPFTVYGSLGSSGGSIEITLKSGEDPGSELYHGFATSSRANSEGAFTHSIEYLAALPEKGSLTLEVAEIGRGPEELDRVSIPLLFDGSTSRQVKLFFANDKLNPGLIDCNKVFDVSRFIFKETAPTSMTLALLLQGPTASEKEAGYLSLIPDAISLPQLTIAQGTATVNFAKDLQTGIGGGSCRVNAVRTQIEQTLYQFPGISGAVIQVEGNSDGVLQP